MPASPHLLSFLSRDPLVCICATAFADYRMPPAFLQELAANTQNSSSEPPGQRRRLETGAMPVGAPGSVPDGLVQDLLRLTLYRSQDVQALHHSSALCFLLTTDESRNTIAASMNAYKAKQEEQRNGDIPAARLAARAKGEALAPHPWGHKKFFNFILLVRTFQEKSDNWSPEQTAAADYLLELSPDTIDREIASCSSKFSSPLQGRTWKFSLMLTAAVSDETRNAIRTLLQAKSNHLKFEPSREGQSQLEQKLWKQLTKK